MTVSIGPSLCSVTKWVVSVAGTLRAGTAVVISGGGGVGGNFRIFVTGCVAGKSKTKPVRITAKPKKNILIHDNYNLFI